MSVTLSPPMFLQFMDPNNSGSPLVGGRLFTYQAGTSIKQNTWTDSTQGTLNTNPIILDSNGACYLWADPTLKYKFVLSPKNDTDPPSSPYRTVDNVESAVTASIFSSFITQSLIGSIFYPRSAGEIAAGVVPSNYAMFYGTPERYGATGNGSSDDTAGLSSCLSSNGFISLTPGATYLFSGLTIRNTGTSIFTPGGTTSTATLKLKDGSGNSGLHFVSSTGNTTHFDTGFVGRNFRITCASGSSKMTGIYCDNAELVFLDNVVIDLSSNSYSGASTGDGTLALLGYFQQDGVFLKCTFTGGSGAHGDGVLLTGSFSGNETPNNNLFLGCRAQSCGGFGVHVLIGDGNTWIGGKIQANTGGGWSDDTDGLSNGPSNSSILDMGFEANSGDDLYINISSGLKCKRVSFESSTATNHIHAPGFMINASFTDIDSPAGKAATFSSNTGNGNIWSPGNHGFILTMPSGVFDDETGGSFNLTYSGLIAVDTSATSVFSLVVTNGSAFTISNPTNARNGRVIIFSIKNFSGGAMGSITWSSQYKLAGSFTNPANNNYRTITFAYDGNAWREISRSAADESS